MKFKEIRGYFIIQKFNNLRIFSSTDLHVGNKIVWAWIKNLIRKQLLKNKYRNMWKYTWHLLLMYDMARDTHIAESLLFYI